MKEKDRLKGIVEDMSGKEALEFIDKYKDFKKKPKNIMVFIHDKVRSIRSIIKQGKWMRV